MIITKANYKLASLLLRIPPHLFPNPLITVTDAIQSSAATSAPLPESAPGSGYNTPIGDSQNGFWSTMEGRGISHRVRLWSLEWLSICVQELGRAAIGEQKAYVLSMPAFRSFHLGENEEMRGEEEGKQRESADDRLALRKHIETDMPAVMTTLTHSMVPPTTPEMEKEAEAACQCAESWVTYGIGAK